MRQFSNEEIDTAYSLLCNGKKFYEMVNDFQPILEQFDIYQLRRATENKYGVELVKTKLMAIRLEDTVTNDVYKVRLVFCATCEKMNLGSCQENGVCVQHVLKIVSQVCPLGKW